MAHGCLGRVLHFQTFTVFDIFDIKLHCNNGEELSEYATFVNKKKKLVSCLKFLTSDLLEASSWDRDDNNENFELWGLKSICV